MSKPIQNLDQIDILGARDDDGVDLMIVATSTLDGSPEHQKLLDKIENYLAYIASPEFKAEFADPPADKVHIILRYYGVPHPIMFAVFEKCKPWVERGGACFRAEAAEDAE